MELKTKLKPCPFCGGNATAYKDDFEKVMISCDECGTMIGVELECGVELVNGWVATFKSPEEAAEAWNRCVMMADGG